MPRVQYENLEAQRRRADDKVCKGKAAREEHLEGRLVAVANAVGFDDPGLDSDKFGPWANGVRVRDSSTNLLACLLARLELTMCRLDSYSEELSVYTTMILTMNFEEVFRRERKRRSEWLLTSRLPQ
jgi:hypothetical protein